jgi:hypothetical protein
MLLSSLELLFSLGVDLVHVLLHVPAPLVRRRVHHGDGVRLLVDLGLVLVAVAQLLPLGVRLGGLLFAVGLLLGGVLLLFLLNHQPTSSNAYKLVNRQRKVIIVCTKRLPKA